MEILLAQPRGFCAGVKRALDIINVALEKKQGMESLYVLHEIVHNKNVISHFIDKGVKFVEQIDDVPTGATLIFSAHGVSRNIEAQAANKKLNVINATCPLVTKVHREAQNYEKQNREMIIIGHADHPEVRGTIGRVDCPIHIIQSVEEAKKFQPQDANNVAYITQTTLSIDDTRHIVEVLTARFPNIAGPGLKDICYATQNRQNAVKLIAKKADMMIIIGSKNSSNSNRLRDICLEVGKPAYLIDHYAELEPNVILDKNVNVIGISAGASAPEALVQESIDFIFSLCPQATVSTLGGIEENVHFALPKELR